MKTFRIICLVVCVILIGFHFYGLNYDDLSIAANKGHYLGIVAMLLVGMSFLFGISKDKNKK